MAAHADVTIVSKTTMVGAMPGMRKSDMGGNADSLNRSATTTTYFQENKVRIDNGQVVYLYDGDTHTRYRIDAKRKTYSVVRDRLGGLSQFAGMFDIKTTVSVVPTGKTQRIAGLTAKEYAYDESIALNIKPGAFPMGASPSPAAKSSPIPAMQIKIHGQHWVSPIPGLPSDIGEVISESSGMSQLTENLPGLKALMDQLKAVKGYPLATQQSFTITGLGMAPGAAGGKSGATMSVDTSTTSIRQAPLPKSLFMIPPGYKQVEPSSSFPAGTGPKRPMPAP
jgi:hypothetical protein